MTALKRLLPRSLFGRWLVLLAVMLAFLPVVLDMTILHVAVPTLTGATAYQLYKHGGSLTSDDFNLIGVGFVVSFFVAWAVVKAFLAVVTRYGFGPFAWYRIIAGIAALIWLGAK